MNSKYAIYYLSTNALFLVFNIFKMKVKTRVVKTTIFLKTLKLFILFYKIKFRKHTIKYQLFRLQ